MDILASSSSNLFVFSRPAQACIYHSVKYMPLLFDDGVLLYVSKLFGFEDKITPTSWIYIHTVYGEYNDNVKLLFELKYKIK